MSQTFGRVVCISLERRPDRYRAFCDRVPSDWPFGEIEMVTAVDGKKCPHPQWWRQGGGAWGCYQSHLRIIEQALNDGVKSLLIFEDDATFVDGFVEKAREFLDRLPGDWGQAYLGGQHLRRPQAVCPGVVRAANINRTHAYAIRGDAMRHIYKWLHATDQWQNRCHIDHHYGRMHGTKSINVYAPEVWLCGQAEDRKSDVSWKPVSERWWMMSRPPEKPPAVEETKTPEIFVAVVGLHRSGSSCVAMMLHKLGINMGDKLGGYEGRNGGGGEAVGLARICERVVRFPKVGISDTVKCQHMLAGWIEERKKKANGRLFGGKYPHLCAMGPMLAYTVGFGKLRVIHCDRPLEDSIDSLKRRSRQCTGWLAITDQQAEEVQRWLWQEKQEFLAMMPAETVLDVRYDRVLDDPGSVVNEICDFLGHTPTPQQIEAAVSHVKSGVTA